MAGSKSSEGRKDSEASKTKDSPAPKITPAPAKVSSASSGSKSSQGSSASASAASKVKASPMDFGSSPSGIGSVSTVQATPSAASLAPRKASEIGVGPSFGNLLDLIETPQISARFLPDRRDALSEIMLKPRGIDFATGLPKSSDYLDRLWRAPQPLADTSSGNSLLFGPDADEDPYSGWNNLTAGLRTLGVLPSEPSTGANEPLEGLTTRKVKTLEIDENGNPIFAPRLSGPNMTVEERDAIRRYVPERLPAEPLPATVGPAPYIPDEGTTVRTYGPNAGYSEPGIAAIDGAMLDVPLPRRRPEPPFAYDPVIREGAVAGDLFETDGQVQTPDGQIIRQGTSSNRNAPAAGINAAAASEEPKVWGTVVDNAGKLLGNTALGGLVSTLFPDMWSAGGDMMKGLGTGEPPGPMRDYPGWDADRGTWVGNDVERNPDPYTALLEGFIDLNKNGVDDRLEMQGEVTTPVVTPAGTTAFDAVPTRTARFPLMPPYNPGISDEWNYFTNNHLADGGMVYAEGGEVEDDEVGALAGEDPRVAMIADTEDVLEKIAEGERPGEADVALLKKFVAQFGDAALKALNDNVTGGMTMRRGRMIKGPGGPKDDAVPAVIVEEGTPVSPAKLSNGEFVMPVEAVEGIGGAEAMQELAERLSKRSAT